VPPCRFTRQEAEFVLLPGKPAGSREQGAGSREQGAGSREHDGRR